MHGMETDDPGRTVDWSAASADYLRYRPGFPESFLRRLEALGVIAPGLRVMDLGTGTGALALALARRGCRVVGVDVAPGQVEAARARARDEGLEVELQVAPAERTGYPGGAFDLVTAAQCWPYFERDAAVAEVRRLLAPGGRLMTCHLSWHPGLDAVARRCEALVLEHNPAWRGAGWSGEVPAVPGWIGEDFEQVAMFAYDEPLPFTRESWRGRLRACRGVAASMTAEEVARFDGALADLLEEITPERFEVVHRIDAHVLVPRRRDEEAP